VKKQAKLAIEEVQKSQKLKIKKITLRDLDDLELDNVAGGAEPTTTVSADAAKGVTRGLFGLPSAGCDPLSAR